MNTMFTRKLVLLASLALGLASLIISVPAIAAQDRFRSESWEFDRHASVRDLNRGSAAQRYSAALGVFFQSVERSERDIQSAIDTMNSVYDTARSKVRSSAGRRELAIFESMLGWFYMGLAETVRSERDKEDAARDGLRYLDTLLREYSDNLDVLFIYVRSTWFVPTTYQDLTKDIKYAGERFLSRTSRNPRDELGRVQRNVVLIALANIAVEENDLDSARSYFKKVDSRALRFLNAYGCGRMEDIYRDIEQTLRGGTGDRVRTVW